MEHMGQHMGHVKLMTSSPPVLFTMRIKKHTPSIGDMLLMATRNPAFTSPVERTVVAIPLFTGFDHHPNGGWPGDF